MLLFIDICIWIVQESERDFRAAIDQNFIWQTNLPSLNLHPLVQVSGIFCTQSLHYQKSQVSCNECETHANQCNVTLSS